LSDFNKDVDELISRASGAKICPMAKLFAKVKAEHGQEAADKITVIVNDPNYPESKIVTMLRKHGYKISRDSLHKHRHNGKPDGCVCNT
jgi:hypothetical protein